MNTVGMESFRKWQDAHDLAGGIEGIESGQVLTMQVDTDAGTLKFWVDGKPHIPGYTSGVTGPLRWATTVVTSIDIDWQGPDRTYTGAAVARSEYTQSQSSNHIAGAFV